MGRLIIFWHFSLSTGKCRQTNNILTFLFIYRFISFYDNVWLYLNVALHLFVPFVLIALLTAFIIYGLQRSRKHRISLMRKSDESGEEMTVLKESRQDGSGGPRKSKSYSTAKAATSNHNQKMLDDTARMERAITLMLIAAGVVFLVLSLPIVLYVIIHGFHAPKMDTVKGARWNRYRMVAYLLCDSSHAINFFLYFCTAKRFRTQLIRILTGRASCYGRRLTRRGYTAGSGGNRGDTGLRS